MRTHAQTPAHTTHNRSARNNAVKASWVSAHPALGRSVYLLPCLTVEFLEEELPHPGRQRCALCFRSRGHQHAMRRVTLSGG